MLLGVPDRDFHPKVSYPKFKMAVISIFNGWLIENEKIAGVTGTFFETLAKKHVFSSERYQKNLELGRK